MTPSLLWLLRHELRLAVRGVAGHGPWIKRMGPRLLLAAIPLVAGIALAVANAGGRQPSSEALLDDLGGLIAAAVVLLGVLMISTAAAAVLRTFYDRHDLDLLLAAPVPPARVMAAKAVGVAVIVATPFLVVFAPYTITSALLGSPRWLAALAIVPIDATLATAAAMALTAGLFAAIGPRRARVAVQLIAAVTGGSIFLLSQVQSFSPEGAKSAFSVLSHRWAGPLDGLAQAAVGRPLPLLVLAALAALAFRAAAAAAAPVLVRAGERDGGTAAARTTRVRFRGGLATAILVKELRLIARDPELIAQVALRLVYLIPITALILRGAGTAAAPAVAATATGFAGLLAASLAWIVVCAEDAPDLLAAAPRSPAAVRRAKLVAACLVPVGLVGLASAGLLTAGAWPAAVTLASGMLAAVTAALIQSWFGRTGPRTAFRRRQQASLVIGLGEVLLAANWAGTAALLVRGSFWALGPALVAGAIVAGAIEAHAADTRDGQRGVGAGASGSRSRVSRLASARQPAE